MTLVNGKESTGVAINDRGLNYGDGVFETVAVSDGEPRFLEEHLERLARGCARLGITPPDSSGLERECRSLIRDRSRCVLKIVVTRGAGGRGYRPEPGLEPTRIVSVFPWPGHAPYDAERGVNVTVCRTRLGINPLLAGIKHLNRLEQVMARSEWDDPKIAEGLMLDSEERLIAGTMSNVFVVRDDVVLTPDLKRCGIDGVTRQWVLDRIPGLGLEVRIRDLELCDIEDCSELFLTNSIIGVRAVGRVLDSPVRLGEVVNELRARLRLEE